MLANLISNGLNYSPDGSPIEIAVGIETDADVVAVRAEAMGIPESKIAKIFAGYHRGGMSSQSCERVFGQHLLEIADGLQGGSASVEGRSFLLCLPRLRPSDSASPT